MTGEMDTYLGGCPPGVGDHSTIISHYFLVFFLSYFVVRNQQSFCKNYRMLRLVVPAP